MGLTFVPRGVQEQQGPVPLQFTCAPEDRRVYMIPPCITSMLSLYPKTIYTVKWNGIFRKWCSITEDGFVKQLGRLLPAEDRHSNAYQVWKRYYYLKCSPNLRKMVALLEGKKTAFLKFSWMGDLYSVACVCIVYVRMIQSMSMHMFVCLNRCIEYHFCSLQTWIRIL